MEQPPILDRYRPLAELGTGGHGSVVLAFDTKMARRVAIKRLPLPIDAAGRPLKRAGLNEARTAALLNHPNIVTVHEWDTDDDEAFIVMENIDGASLADLLDETDEALDDDEAAAVLDAIGAAVTFAHENGVLHLDIKPGNVLIARDGRVKIADFGVSALTDSYGRARGSSGTIGYMPPEQIRGQHLDERTDVWALGALMYEALTNANPFDADTPEGSLFKIEMAEVPAPSEFEPSLSPDVDDAILDAVAAAPEDRPSAIAAVAATLLPQLGDPALGRDSLAARVGEVIGDEVPADDEYAPLGLWDRLAGYGPWVRRAGAALICGWLAWAGAGVLVSTPGADWTAGALCALAAGIAPGLGLALGLGAFVAGLWVQAGWVAGMTALVVAGAYWILAGRTGGGEALLPGAAPVLSLARCAPAAPLLAGFVFPPVRAAIAGGASAVVVVLASTATGGVTPLQMGGWTWIADPWGSGVSLTAFIERIAQPSLLAIVASWTIAAAVCSLGCRRVSRPGAMVGALIGAAVLTVGAWVWASTSASSVPLALMVNDLLAGFLLMLAVTVAGPPIQPGVE